MGKVISLINTTLDGYSDAQFLLIDDEFHEFARGLMADIDTVAFGRNTFELFQNIWPPRLENENATSGQRRLAKALTDIPKVVYSSTLKMTIWDNSMIESKIDTQKIKAYKLKGKKGLLTVGSVILVATLTEMNLIDEYYFCIQPHIAGHGNVLLSDKLHLDTIHSLKYMDSTTLKSGVHIIHYQNAN